LLAAANIGSFTGVLRSSCWWLELFLLYRFADKEGNEKGALGCGRKKERKKESKQASKQAIISNEHLGAKKID